MTPAVRRAHRELELAGLFAKDSDYNGMLGRLVMKLLKALANEKPSGFAAYAAADLFYTLVRGGCLTPLRGTADEWVEVTPADAAHTTRRFQNNRMTSVFADDAYGNGATWIEGRVFKEASGATFTAGAKSHVAIAAFPWVPERQELIVEGTPEAEPYADLFVK